MHDAGPDMGGRTNRQSQLGALPILGEIKLRECMASDFSEIANMEMEYYLEVDPSEAFDAGKFHDEFWGAVKDPRKKIMVAQVAGQLAGFIWLEEYDEPDGVLGYISNIHVGKKYRNLGIAKYLLNKAEEHFKSRNIRRAQLEVVESNKAAFNLYRKFGYIANGDYMEKSLT